MTRTYNRLCKRVLFTLAHCRSHWQRSSPTMNCGAILRLRLPEQQYCKFNQHVKRYTPSTGDHGITPEALDPSSAGPKRSPSTLPLTYGKTASFVAESTAAVAVRNAHHQEQQAAVSHPRVTLQAAVSYRIALQGMQHRRCCARSTRKTLVLLDERHVRPGAGGGEARLRAGILVRFLDDIPLRAPSQGPRLEARPRRSGM